MEERRGKKWGKVKAYINLSLSIENSETRDLPFTVSMMHVTDNQKARKRKTYADVVKATQTQPLVSENISSHVNEKYGENQFDLGKIKSLLIKDENLNSSRIATSPPNIINNMSIVSNCSNFFSKSGEFETFDTQDRVLLDILEELGNVEKAKEHDVNVTRLGRLRGHFCSDTIFNLSHRVVSGAEIKGIVK